MVNQITIRLRISHHIKTGGGNPLEVKRSQKQATESDISHAPTIRRPQEDQATQL